MRQHDSDQNCGLVCRTCESNVPCSGRPAAFIAAMIIVILWAVTGPFFGFSDTWQLVINTGTTIVTFLMVFLIQSTQNRDSEAVQLKLDELIRAVQGAQNALLNLEDLNQEDLDRLREAYAKLAKESPGGMAPPLVITKRTETK